ncbi:glutaminase [Morganella morganii]|uniref:Glutaminase n=1 Tax=bacterium 19GA11TI05 TaxID=2920688 RepID=A0AAU6TUN1_UNCXX|nr:glutaminase [Morganella morganii]
MAIYSPPLDKAGNNVRTQTAIRYITQETDDDLYQ